MPRVFPTTVLSLLFYSFTHLQMWSAQGHSIPPLCPALQGCAVTSRKQGPHFSLLSGHARAVMLTHKVLLSGQLRNIFTLMCSLGAHLAPLIIDLHRSSLVKVQGRSHRPDSHSTWHAERGKTDYCSKETVSLRNQLHVSHRSPHWRSHTDCSTGNCFSIFHLPGKNCQEISTQTKKLLNC